MTDAPSLRSRVRGCLLGGAIGDALGAPVEFMSLPQIQAQYGSQGITDFDEAYGRRGAITDDTQMTLFTAEGMLRAEVRMRERGICNPAGVVRHAYYRWLATQGAPVPDNGFDNSEDSWLVKVPALHARRAPGNTCLSALMSGEMGTTYKRLNDSKGCGGVMRVAPVGLLAQSDRAFEIGCDVAALTHSHPSGYLAAGALALMVALVREGDTLEEAVEAAAVELRWHDGHEECLDALDAARGAAASCMVSAETLEQLGEGWVAEEALAMSVYCALVCRDDFESGVQLAVNHGGDSDSTGAITGNLLGAMLGEEAIPQRWLAKLELHDVIEEVAEDVSASVLGDEVPWSKYPGW